YGGGGLCAVQGSWHRAPFPQGGYNVVFVPFANGKPSGSYEIFADGFAGAVKQPGQAAHRPTGLAVGPDGALYITDDAHGRIWRVTYIGATRGAVPAAAPPPATPAAAPGPPEGIHADAAALAAAGITPAMITLGDSVYHGQVGGATCVGCHGPDAKGPPRGPDLTGHRWLWGDGSVKSIERTIAQGVRTPREHAGVMAARGGGP